MKEPVAALIPHYPDPDRRPVQERHWSRKHALSQQRLCELHAAPFFG